MRTARKLLALAEEVPSLVSLIVFAGELWGPMAEAYAEQQQQQRDSQWPGAYD